MVEDTRKGTVGKMIGGMTEVAGKAISLLAHILGTRNSRRVKLIADRMLETGDRLSRAATITTVPTPGRVMGTLGIDLEGTRGPMAISHEEKAKGKKLVGKRFSGEKF